jgi:hypothetical protein
MGNCLRPKKKNPQKNSQIIKVSVKMSSPTHILNHPVEPGYNITSVGQFLILKRTFYFYFLFNNNNNNNNIIIIVTILKFGKNLLFLFLFLIFDFYFKLFFVELISAQYSGLK